MFHHRAILPVGKTKLHFFLDSCITATLPNSDLKPNLTRDRPSLLFGVSAPFLPLHILTKFPLGDHPWLPFFLSLVLSSCIRRSSRKKFFLIHESSTAALDLGSSLMIGVLSICSPQMIFLDPMHSTRDCGFPGPRRRAREETRDEGGDGEDKCGCREKGIEVCWNGASDGDSSVLRT